MTTKRTAVLLDGGFVVKRLYHLLKKSHPTADQVYEFAKKCVEADEELFRIYYYDCYPYGEVERHPLSGQAINFATSATFARHKTLLDALATKDHVALREGVLSFDGWEITREATTELIKKQRPIVAADVRPDMKQKRVDMKIGLDVAWLASKGLVQRIVMATADSDFVPAMKFARREGVQVVLVPMGTKLLKRDLIVHADIVRSVTYP